MMKTLINAGKTFTVLIFIITFTVACSSTSKKLTNNEKLITPNVLHNGKWTVSTVNNGTAESTIWKSKARGLDDIFVVKVFRGLKEHLNATRVAHDAAGREACKSFQSTVLDPIPNNYYDSMIWRTVCTNHKDTVSQMLQLAISGNEGTYVLQKMWRGEVSNAEISDWISKFRQTYVCDTSSDAKHCPSSYQELTGIFIQLDNQKLGASSFD